MALRGGDVELQNEGEWARQAFGARYAPLYRFLLARLRRKEDAEDLMQETFLRLLRVPNAEVIRQPDAYLFRIAANLVLEFRMRARHSLVAFDSEQADAAAHSVEVAHSADGGMETSHADSERLQQAIDSLPARWRTALVLHRRDELTYAQIGARLGVSSNMVKKYLASALARCRVALGAKP